MSSVRFEIKEEDIIHLQQQIIKFGNDSEVIINGYLRNQGANIGIKEITNVLPASGRKWKGKGKAAKSSNPFQSDFVNLGFTIRTKKKYNYLVFPDQGIGTSIKNNPLEFMDKGFDKAYDQIIYGILSSLQIKIEEDLL